MLGGFKQLAGSMHHSDGSDHSFFFWRKTKIYQFYLLRLLFYPVRSGPYMWRNKDLSINFSHDIESWSKVGFNISQIWKVSKT